MKKHVLALMAIFTIATSFAQFNDLREYRLNSNSKTHSRINVSTKNVYTDYREILWTTFSNNWDTTLSYAYHLDYSDNRIITKFGLDYIGSHTYYKEDYIYDIQNKLIQINIFYFDETDSTYTLFRRDLYNYYNNNLKKIIISQEFDSNTQLWLTKNRKIEEVDYNGNLILSMQEEYISNAWKVQNYFGKGYTYHNNTKKLVLEIDSTYSSSTKKTFARNKTERVYNNLDQLIEFKRYNYSNNKLELGTIIKIEYNNLGIPIRELAYHANQFPILVPWYKADSITWLNFNGDIEYFENVQLTTVDSGYQNSAYYYAGRTIGLKLDTNNSYSVAYYQVVNNVLEKFNRIDGIFDRNKNLVEYTSYFVDTNNEWEISSSNKYIISYDFNNNISEYIEQLYDQNQFVNYKKKEYSNYITIDVSSSIHSTKNIIETIIYPNPSNNGRVSVNVKMGAASALNIKVIDLKGSVVYSQTENLGKGLNTIELIGLQQGMYVVEMSSEFGIARKKLVIN